LVKTWLIHIKLIATIIMALSTFGVERVGDSMANENTIIEQTIEAENKINESTIVCALFSSSKGNSSLLVLI
jgi:hypothetical protein